MSIILSLPESGFHEVSSEVPPLSPFCLPSFFLSPILPVTTNWEQGEVAWIEYKTCSSIMK